MNKGLKYILMVSPCFPDKHDLALYTEGLLKGFKRKFSDFFNFRICAVAAEEFSFDCFKEVQYKFNPLKRMEYFTLADNIMQDKNIETVIIQYDFKSYGDNGENLLFLLYRVNKPILLTLHHIPENANHKQKELLKNIASSVSVIIPINENQGNILANEYEISAKKIVLIPDKTNLDKNLTRFTNIDTASIAYDNKAIVYADILRQLSEDKKPKYAVPDLSPELLEKIANKKFYPDILRDNFLSHLTGIVRIIYLHFKLYGTIYNMEMLEANIKLLHTGIRNHVGYFSINKSISRKEEQDMADAFSALALILSLKNTGKIKQEYYIQAEEDYKAILQLLPFFKSLSALTSIIKGLYLFPSFPGNTERVIKIADQLIEKYYHDAQIEDKKTWTNNFFDSTSSKLPEALLYAYLASKKEIYKVIAIVTFDWLIANLFRKGFLCSISKTATASINDSYGNKPAEVTEIIWTLNLFHEVFHDMLYRKYLKVAFSWFAGNNSISTAVYYPGPVICFDGIRGSKLISSLSGSSSMDYLIARFILEINNKNAENSQTGTKERKGEKLVKNNS